MAEFQGEAKRLLEPAEGQPPSIPQLQALQACLERGAAYGIPLPEIARLKQVFTEFTEFFEHPNPFLAVYVPVCLFVNPFFFFNRLRCFKK